MAKKKLTEKIAEAVDHMIHPDHVQPTGNEIIDDLKIEDKEGSSSLPPEYQMHPKFDKFKPVQIGEEVNDK